MISTIEQANNYNTLLDIKERIEERYRPKGHINIINRMPRIKWVSVLEEELMKAENAAFMTKWEKSPNSNVLSNLK